MNKLAKFILPAVLVALMVLWFSHPVSGFDGVPSLSIKPAPSITVSVCSRFTIEIWITDIPTELELSMMGFNIYVGWDPTMMECVGYENYAGERGWDAHDEMSNVKAKYTLMATKAEEPFWQTDARWASITFHCKGAGTSTITLSSPRLDTIWLWDGDEQIDTYPEPFEITCNQVGRPVGGVLTPVNKLEILAPYLALVGLVGAVTAAVAIQRRRET